MILDGGDKGVKEHSPSWLGSVALPFPLVLPIRPERVLVCAGVFYTSVGLGDGVSGRQSRPQT